MNFSSAQSRPNNLYEKQSQDLEGLAQGISTIPTSFFYGEVSNVQGLLVTVRGLEGCLAIGNQCVIHTKSGKILEAEVVSFQEGKALLMPSGFIEGVGPGCRVERLRDQAEISPTEGWLGRVIDGQGKPIDGRSYLPTGIKTYPVFNSPPPAHARRLVGGPLNVGLRAINTFMTCCEGQRMGIFAGSGVGKSVLLSQLARFTSADVIVIGLIGERGREVQEFLQKHLGEEGLKKAVVVVSTSDEPPLMRRQAAFLAVTVAEYFRDQGAKVLCLMDSVTRVAMALREIGLAIGEPPTTKGYTPSVFAQLPRLLERTGPGTEGQEGDITGLFTVLVDGDDHNEPIADAVRGILDGHIVLERKIAERNRFPAINVLKSISRTVPDCHAPEQRELVVRARQLMSTYNDMEEMIRLGAYRKGSDPRVDEAINYHSKIEAFIGQKKEESFDLKTSFDQLSEILK